MDRGVQSVRVVAGLLGIALLSAAARGQCFEWSQGFGLPGNGLSPPRGLEVFDDGSGPALVAGGYFLQGPLCLLRWTGSGWEAFPGTSRLIYEKGFQAMAVHAGPGGIPAGLYVMSSLDLLHYDGQAWHDLGPVVGPPVSPGVWTMELFDAGSGAGHHLFLGTTLGDSHPGWGVLEWDGSAWSVPGEGVSAEVRAFAAFDDGSGTGLCAGGWFYRAGVPQGSVDRWDGTSWSRLGTLDRLRWGSHYAEVRALASFDDGTGPALYVGGQFDTVDGRRALNVARWNGKVWSAVGSGLDWTVTALEVFDDGTRKVLIAASGPLVASWDGASWSSIGGLSGTKDNQATDLQQLDEGGHRALWVGGYFHSVSGWPSVNIARWREECPCRPRSYCTAKTSSTGCVPAIGASGGASASVPTPFIVTASQVDNQTSGLFFYGRSGWEAKPFHGGTLCVAPPWSRTPLQASGGLAPPPGCSGSFAIDFNAWIQGGNDPGLVAGAMVHGQYWYRDPGSPLGTGLSDGITFSICP